VIEDHRLRAHRRRLIGPVHTHEWIELGPPGLTHCEVPELASLRFECRGVSRARGAVEVEEPAYIDVARLAGVEAMEYLGLHARKEMRHGIARGEHRARVEGAHFARRAQPRFVRVQFLASGAIEEPHRDIAARADGGLQRPQDRERVAFGAVQQVVPGHAVP
jgi:hypothetical protein